MCFAGHLPIRQALPPSNIRFVANGIFQALRANFWSGRVEERCHSRASAGRVGDQVMPSGFGKQGTQVSEELSGFFLSSLPGSTKDLKMDVESRPLFLGVWRQSPFDFCEGEGEFNRQDGIHGSARIFCRMQVRNGLLRLALLP